MWESDHFTISISKKTANIFFYLSRQVSCSNLPCGAMPMLYFPLTAAEGA
jgi:hypothetical protein